MTVKGDLKVETDEQGIEVRITITPEENGGEITPDSIEATLVEMKVRAPLDREAVDKAFRSLARKRSEPVSFLAAVGVAPQPPTPESVVFEPTPLPRLAALSRKVVGAAPPARGFRLREQRVKTEKKVMRKAALPFLPPREEIQVSVEKKVVREEVRIDPTVMETGFAGRGSVVARVQPGKQGKQGKSVFGLLVPVPAAAGNPVLFLEGLARSGSEVKAGVTGFLRKGVGWCDIVPFEDHVLELASSADHLTCLLTFTPGSPEAPPPDADELVARAGALGFDEASLIPAREIAAMLRDAVSRRTPLAAVPLTPTQDGLAKVGVSEDRLKAVLVLRKGQGKGTALTPAMASNAIKTSKVRGYNLEAVRRDLRAFFDGSEKELSDYLLVEGKPPRPGSDSKIEWLVPFLSEGEGDGIRASLGTNPDALKAFASRDDFPSSRIEAVARVKADAEVLRITPSQGGIPGIDVFGAAIPPDRGAATDVRLFEGVQLRRSTVIATREGILEKGSDGMAVLLRVRPYRDAAIRVTVAPDRMKAALSYSPPEGGGISLTASDVQEQIRLAGVKRGVLEERLLQALDRISRGVPLADFHIAEGRPPRYDTSARINFHVRLATGNAVTFRDDGSADFRAQDRITRVRADELIATVRPRDPHAEDGWDVGGDPIAPPPEAVETLQAGRGVRGDLQTDGSTRFFAGSAGELRRDGNVLSVMDAHFVRGDVDMSSGNVNFPGNVRIGGTIRSGFTVVAGGVLEVEGAVEAALLSAEGGITIGQGIKGEGKAILRSKHGIESMFAEQAALLSIGNVHLHGPCVRCQVKCNGRLLLDSEKGNLVGGEIRASQGVVLQNIGTPGGIRTVVSFGQDFLVRDQIERAEKDIDALAARIGELNAEMRRLDQAAGGAPQPPQSPLGKARAAKVAAMKLLDQRKLQLIGMRDKFDEHVPSAVVVRGTLFPGAVLECHGRRYETRTEKRMITLRFDPEQGRIVEKL